MGYVFRLEDAERCHEWSRSETGRAVLEIEKQVLLRLWDPSCSQRVLEVGCGTGLFLEWLDGLGHQATGLDPSPEMLKLARLQLPQRIALDQAYAERLPYEDNTFDTVAMITSIEFVDDPLQAVREACRVARRHVLLGAFNRYSPITWARLLEGFHSPSYFNHARFYSVFGLRGLFREALSGPPPVHWRTCLTLPSNALRRTAFLERSPLFHFHPFGHFIAMRVDMTYPLNTVQQPVFSDLSHGIVHAPLRPSCWRYPIQEDLRAIDKFARDRTGLSSGSGT